ncbi:hypothetical protein C8T65DRAFT_747552 [Cerioporus squamosus]|nr:hypothetical protein C8T65DRAFT_747552 [Cerioporus squamosus]
MASLPAVQYIGCQVANCDHSCGLFVPEAAPVLSMDALADAKYLATKCLICHHYGAQHIAARTVPVSEPHSASAPPTGLHPQSATSSASTAPRSSSYGPGRSYGATEATLSGSRSGALPTFLSQAERREQREKVQTTDEGQRAFNPAAKAYEASAQLKSKAVPQKRKKHSAPASANATSASQAAGGKKARKDAPVPTKEYTVVLVEATDEVHAHEYPKPNLKKLQDLNDAGHVQPVTLPKQASNDVLKTAVISAFTVKPEFAQVSDPGWHLLKVDIQGPGRTSLLKPVPQGDMNKVTFLEWEKALMSTSIRGAGAAYHHLIFISLVSGAGNLALSPSTESDASDAEPMTGLEAEDIEDAPPTTKPAASEPLHPSHLDDSDQPQETPRTSMPHAQNTESVPMSHRTLRRLLRNMEAPDKDEKWWLWTPSGSPFEEFARHTSMIEFVLSPWLGDRGPLLDHMALLCELPRAVYGPLRFLSELAREGRRAAPKGDPEKFIEFQYEVKFTELFAIGPGGLHGVLDPLDHLYEFVTEYSGLKARQRDEAFSQLRQLSDDCLWLVQHFRFKIARILYDPTGGFREFEVAYKKTEFYMDVATIEQWKATEMREFLPRRTWIKTCSIDRIVSILTDAFGHTSDYTEMTSLTLQSGGCGVEAVLTDLVWPLLDVIDDAHPNYWEVRRILEVFCRELTKKLNQFRADKEREDRERQGYHDPDDANNGKGKEKATASESSDEDFRFHYQPYEPNSPPPTFHNESSSPAPEESEAGAHRSPSPPPPPAPEEPATPEPEDPEELINGIPYSTALVIAQKLRDKSWRMIVKTIIEKLNHPLTPLPDNWPTSDISPHRQYMVLCPLYHPDRNSMLSVAWKTIIHHITQAILAKRPVGKH